MNNLKEVLNNFTEDDYKNNRVNLHIHTKHSVGLGDENQILQSAKSNGYKMISITDHNTVEAHNNIKDDILLTGAEFDCWFGYVFIHLLAYGIDIENEEFKKFLAKDKSETEHVLPRLFSSRNVKDLINAIHSAGGIAVLAHPACCWAISMRNLFNNLLKLGLDGVEGYYPYSRFRRLVKFRSAKSILKLAQKYPGLIITGGTDFHGETF